jgi:double-stranded uracil-DNA glycosylase
VIAPLESAVPDYLGANARIVFCGINPGHWSARARAPFANPRNDFWRLLHAAGFTPRLLEPQEASELVPLGFGLTNAAGRTTRGAGELRKADFAGAAERLEHIAETIRPEVIAFVGKAAYTGTFGGRVELGLQERKLGDTALFVLPSTSPANAAVPWDERLRWFRTLRELVP